MGKVIMSGIVPKLEKPKRAPIGDPVFANNDWATIITACQLDAVHDTWEVGDQLTMTINGTDYTIDIIGKNHDEYADGSGIAPLTFQMNKCYATAYAMNSTDTNVGGWAECAMRTTRLPAILALMPSEVQAAIREVNKSTFAGNASTTIDTTADKLFLLSEFEMWGTTKFSTEEEGSQYEYYAAGNSVIKYVGSAACSYWMRSPGKNGTYGFAYAGTNGISVQYLSANEKLYICPAFCF